MGGKITESRPTRAPASAPSASTRNPLNGQVFSWMHSSGRQLRQPNWVLVTHMFNHETHHRGQVHCLLTGLGAKPDDTDIPWLPVE